MGQDHYAHLTPDQFRQTAMEFAPQFVRAYDRLAECGQADQFGGAESRRVFFDWFEASQPENVVAFILLWANIRPNG